MLKKTITMFVSILFIWMQTSISYAQNIHFNAFDNYKNYHSTKIQSKGLTAQAGFRIPFGVQNKNTKQSFYGFKLTYGQSFSNSNPYQYGTVRDLNLLKSGFDRSGVRSLSVAHMELFKKQNRTNLFGIDGENRMIWGLVAVLAIGGGLWAAGVFDGEDSTQSGDGDSSGSS